MIIAINARSLKEVPKDGIGWFTYEVISRMTRKHTEHHFILLCDRKYTQPPVEGTNIEYITIKPRNVHPLLWWYWHERQLPTVLNRIGADVLVAPDGLLPLGTTMPCVPVIHDLSHVHRPADIPLLPRHFYRHFFPRYAKKAKRIATVSHFCAQDISVTYDIDPGKIDVVYNGVAEIFSPPEGEEADKTRKEFTGGRPYFLFVSNFSPRKNIETLVNAYNIFRAQNDCDHVLLLAGHRLYLTRGINRALDASPYSSDILFTGNVSRDILKRLYGAAEAFTFVPWFEGFGIPVVEAMRCGAPCILSDTTSLPEVSGGAALCAGPADAGAIAEAMARLVNDEALRRRLSQQGITNSLRYSWDKTADALWNCVLKATEINQCH